MWMMRDAMHESAYLLVMGRGVFLSRNVGRLRRPHGRCALMMFIVLTCIRVNAYLYYMIFVSVSAKVAYLLADPAEGLACDCMLSEVLQASLFAAVLQRVMRGEPGSLPVSHTTVRGKCHAGEQKAAACEAYNVAWEPQIV